MKSSDRLFEYIDDVPEATKEDNQMYGTVICFDNTNDYYDPKLKEYRLSLIEKAVEILTSIK